LQSEQINAPENANLHESAKSAGKPHNFTICFFAYTLTIAN
tara:strand:+ start:397 stop:519 length:123 start_codon:yes stop_codon:yes gene_type:complete